MDVTITHASTNTRARVCSAPGGLGTAGTAGQVGLHQGADPCASGTGTGQQPRHPKPHNRCRRHQQ
eukprot:1139318-Pelagomonas_calceolata.AAC.1